MPWTTIVVVSTGELATAAVQNDQVLGNLTHLRGGGMALASQAAGDILYATGASQWGRLAAGAAGKFLAAGATPSWATVSGGGLNICEGRLTATTGVAVTTADVSGATSIYFTPYQGNRIALYDGSTTWNVRTFTQITISLGGATASKPYDMFAYDNAGTVTIESLVWTNDTTRATALTLQDGVLVKTGATTRRYIGTIYINSSGGQTDDTVAKRWIWNYAHRVPRAMWVHDLTNGWVYTVATFRQANGSAANQLDFVVGVAEDAVHALVFGSAEQDTLGVGYRVAIGLDSTSTPATGCLINGVECPATGKQIPVSASLVSAVAAGRHTLVWLEHSEANGTTDWVGDNGAAQGRSGINGVVRG